MSDSFQPGSGQRFHDLDALRAFAMLLGIALHAALSFTGFPWIVQDSHSSFVFAMLVATVHGFRMQLFMLVSGFFTMLLYRKRGLQAVSKQRFRRVFVPCMIGLVTIVPALDFVSYLAMRKSPVASNADAGDPELAVYAAVRKGDTEALKKALDTGADPNQYDKRFGIPLLGWAALKGDVEAARILLDAGAKIDIRSKNGSHPAHHAAFMGHVGILDLLVQRGADLKTRSNDGHSAADVARTDDEATRYFAGILGLKIDSEDDLRKGRAACLKILENHIETTSKPISLKRPGLLTQARIAYAGWISSDRFQTPLNKFGRPIHLFETDIFHHLWFLWYLCWLAGFFAIAASAAGQLPNTGPLWRRLQGTSGFVSLIALTMIPQGFMGTSGDGALGPDTSTGILPMPHLLLYYGLFFAYGALMFDAGDQAFEPIERNGWWFRIGLCLALPATFATYGGNPVASGLAQCVYSWTMIFGLIRLFRKRFPDENRKIRYVADSSYWLYLAHLPLVVAAQSWISPWNLPSGVKFLGLTACSTALLLVSYQILVRHTWIGRLLNGPRPTAKLTSTTT